MQLFIFPKSKCFIINRDNLYKPIKNKKFKKWES